MNTNTKAVLKPANERLEGIDGLTEGGYLDMPLICCRTTRPHSFSRPRPDPAKAGLLQTIKRWLRIR